MSVESEYHQLMYQMKYATTNNDIRERIISCLNESGGTTKDVALKFKLLCQAFGINIRKLE